MNPKLRHYLSQREAEFDRIETTRRVILKDLSRYMELCQTQKRPKRLVFICTHNSRRSHMAQAAAVGAAEYYQTKDVLSYSGGTEATAVFGLARQAIESSGFALVPQDAPEKTNPVLLLNTGGQDGDGTADARDSESDSIRLFSKRYNEAPNPTKEFAAIMVCSDADEACPVVTGAEVRLALPFEDPKAFDGSPLASEKYQERMADITREVMFAFSLQKQG